MTNEIDELLRARAEITKSIATQQELVVQSKEAAKRAQGKEAVALAKTILGAMYTVGQFVKLLDQYDAEIASHYDSLASRFIQELDEQKGYLLEIESFVQQGILPQEALDNQRAVINSLSERLQADPDLAVSVAKRRNVTAYVESEASIATDEVVPQVPVPDVEIPHTDVPPHRDENIDQLRVAEPAESEFVPLPQHPNRLIEVFPGFDQPEFGPLSRRDIAVLAAAISAHQDLLTTLGSEHGLRLLDQDTLRRLIRICGDQPVIDGRTTAGRARTAAIAELRSKALIKIQAFLESEELPKILDQIDQQGNADVWALLLNLDEMRGLITHTDDGIFRGIDLISRVLTEEKTRADLRAVRVRQKPVVLRASGEVERIVIAPVAPPIEKRVDVIPPIVLEGPAITETVVQSAEALVDAEQDQDAVDEQPEEIVDSTEQSTNRKKKTHKENKRIQGARIALHALLVDVLSKDALASKDGSNKNIINGCYRRIKASFIEDLETSRLLGPRKFAHGHRVFDQAQIATILYFYDHQNDPRLTPQLKKEIYDLAAEQLSDINELIQANETKKK